MFLIPKGDVETRFPRLHLGNGVCAYCGLNGVLYISNVDPPSGRLVAINGEIEIWLADDPEDAQVFDASHRGHLRQNLIGIC